MENFNENKGLEKALVPNKEMEHDPIKLQYLTLLYAELRDAKGKLWIINFGNNEWREQTEESFLKEDLYATEVSSDRIEFVNKEDAFLYLKTLAFKKEIEKSISIAQEHGLNTNVYQNILDLLNNVDKEPDDVKRKQLLVDSYRMYEEEA